MSEIKQIEKEVHPFLGAVLGAILGALAGSMAISALNNKETRKKLGDTLNNLTHSVLETLKDANTEQDGLQTVAKKTLEEKIDKVGDKYLNN